MFKRKNRKKEQKEGEEDEEEYEEEEEKEENKKHNKKKYTKRGSSESNRLGRKENDGWRQGGKAERWKAGAKEGRLAAREGLDEHSCRNAATEGHVINRQAISGGVYWTMQIGRERIQHGRQTMPLWKGLTRSKRSYAISFISHLSVCLSLSLPRLSV